MVEANQNENQD